MSIRSWMDTRCGCGVYTQRNIYPAKEAPMGELEDMMLGAVSQSQKDRYCVTALT